LTVIICPVPVASVGHVPWTVGNIEAPVPPGLEALLGPLLEPELLAPLAPLDPLELDVGPPELPPLPLPPELVDPLREPEPPLEPPDPLPPELLAEELGWELELVAELPALGLAPLPCAPPALLPELPEALPEVPFAVLAPPGGVWFEKPPPPAGAALHAAPIASATMAIPEKMYSKEPHRSNFMRLPLRQVTLTRVIPKGVLSTCQKSSFAIESTLHGRFPW
jgi:hypothetical protein